MVRIQLFGAVATITGRQWKSDNATLQSLLEADLKYFIRLEASDPWQEMTIARDAVSRYGAEIVASIQPPFDPNVVY